MISVLQFGTIDYSTGLRLQEKVVALRKEGRIGDVLLLLEHTPVITLGRNAKSHNIVASPEVLARRGVEVHECDRGGDVTFHGPGQLVAYPIFDLRGFPSDIENRKTLGAVEFVRRLEEALIRTCGEFGIPAKRIAGLTGVWTDQNSLSSRAEQNDSFANRSVESRDLLLERSRGTQADDAGTSQDARLPHPARFSKGGNSGDTKHENATTPEAKIAALGIHISRGVTSHGVALNVNADLSFFDLIIPCGIASKPVISMQKELGHTLPMQEVAHALSRNFGQVFESQILWLDSLDALLGTNLGVPMKPPEELRKLRGEDDIAWA